MREADVVLERDGHAREGADGFGRLARSDLGVDGLRPFESAVFVQGEKGVDRVVAGADAGEGLADEGLGGGLAGGEGAGDGRDGHGFGVHGGRVGLRRAQRWEWGCRIRGRQIGLSRGGQNEHLIVNTITGLSQKLTAHKFVLYRIQSAQRRGEKESTP